MDRRLRHFTVSVIVGLVSDATPQVQVHQHGGTNAGAPETGDRFGEALVAVPGEDRGSVADAGMAYLGLAPGTGRSVQLLPPDPQRGGWLSMVPMRISADLTA